MQADSFVVTATSLNCPLDDNILLSFAPEYLTNLPFLTKFLADNNKLKLINDLTYLNRSIKASLPELTIASKDYKARLAIEEASMFDSQQAINNTLEDEKIFENLGNYVISDLLQNNYHTKNFDFLNAFDWLIIFLTIFGFSALILTLIMFALLAATRGAQAYKFPKHLTYTKMTNIPETVTLDFLQFQDTLRKLFPVELILLLSFIVSVLAFFTYLLYRYCKSVRARTSLMLELETFTRNIGTLPLTAGFYAFHVNRQATEIHLHENFLNMELRWTGFNVEDNTLNRPAPVPTGIKIYPWEIIKIRRIIGQQFYALLHILGVNNELIDIVVLRKSHGPAQVGSAMSTVATTVLVPSIYPTRTLEEIARRAMYIISV